MTARGGSTACSGSTVLAGSTQRATRRRVLAEAGTAAATGALAAACGPVGGPATGQGPGAGTAGPVSLTLWDRDEPGYPPFMDAWLPQFNAKYAGKITLWEPRPPQWGEKLTAAIVAGTPPDAAAVFGSWFRSLLEARQALALDKYIKAARFDADDFVQGVYKGMNFQGTQVGIPQYINTNTVYYNAEVFKRLGVPLPAENWTQDQFLDAAQKLTRGPLNQREVWGLSLAMDSITTRVISLCWGAGAQYNDPKNPDVFTLNTPQNIKALQWVHDLAWKHRVAAKNNDDRGGIGQDDALLTAGKVAMIIEGTHKIPEWKSKGLDQWNVAMLPKGPGGRGERLSMDGYIIPTGAKAPDSSWIVLQEITSKEANKMRAEINGFVPARKSQFEVWIKSIPGKNLKYAVASDEARVDPGSIWPKANDVTGAINPIWRRLFITNELSVQDALKQMQDAVVGILGPMTGR
jgi:multiple sugar transport system substrate-binding protein